MKKSNVNDDNHFGGMMPPKTDSCFLHDNNARDIGDIVRSSNGVIIADSGSVSGKNFV